VPAEQPIVALGELLWDLLPTGPRAGGAPFNFAFHCHQLGHPAIIVSSVGDDDLGRQLRAEVRRLGMSDEFIQTDRQHPTGTVQVSLDAAGQPTYTIAEYVAWDFIDWEPRLENLTRLAAAVCFGTLAQRAPVSGSTIRRFVIESNTLIVLDLNLRPTSNSPVTIRDSLALADWLKLNDDELNRLPVEVDRSSFDLFCVTRGANGCRITTAAETVDVPGISVKVVDTVGAGDAFTAALLTQHLQGKPLAEAARFANAYAAVVASKAGGTPTVTRAEVERLLTSLPRQSV
jgi:fructokinase